MKRYDLAELIKRWEREDVTVEQAIGQMLLWLTALSERVTSMEITQQKQRRRSK